MSYIDFQSPEPLTSSLILIRRSSFHFVTDFFIISQKTVPVKFILLPVEYYQSMADKEKLTNSSHGPKTF